jgi:sulfinoalanine decarboxylase/sulfinoalanine decarboxylase/aspartate 1-decarboxylase
VTTFDTPTTNDLDQQRVDATRAMLERALAAAAEVVQAEHDQPSTTYRTVDEMTAHVDLSLDTAGLDIDAVLDLIREVALATPRTGSRLFFNQLFSGRQPAATAAEVLAAVLNTSLYTYKVAGPHALIEKAVTKRMASMVGYPNGEGIFCPGGSLANMGAMVIARNQAFPDFKEEGNAAVGGQRLISYTSRLCHYSIPKNANILGLGRNNVRKIDMDERGRMIPEALDAAIRADLDAGHRPFFINATAGTTVLAAFDPLHPIADIADEHGIHLHLDGALGCSVLMSEQHRHLCDGSERAHTTTWNIHKMLGVPLPSSVLLTREPGLLYDTFNQTATYLFQQDKEDLNLGTRSIQCGRRNDAFKAWAAWKHRGDEGFGRRVDHLFDLARYTADIVRNDPAMKLSKEPESVTACFEVNGRDSTELCELLRTQNRAMVGYAHVDGRRVIRLALVNGDIGETEIDEFFGHLREVAAQLPDKGPDVNVID